MSNIPHSDATYDPNDLEALMMHKSFSELYEDERAFALQHIADEDEYNSMRQMLLQLHDLSLSKDLDQSVPQDIKTQIVQEIYGSDRRVISVNWKIWKQDAKWYRQPLLHVVSAAAVVTLGLFIIRPVETGFSGKGDNMPQDSSQIILEDSRFFNGMTSSAPPAPERLYADAGGTKSVEVLSNEDWMVDEAQPILEAPADEMKNAPLLDSKSSSAPMDEGESALVEDSGTGLTTTSDSWNYNTSSSTGTIQVPRLESEEIVMLAPAPNHPGCVSLKDNLRLLDLLYSAE